MVFPGTAQFYSSVTFPLPRLPFCCKVKTPLDFFVRNLQVWFQCQTVGLTGRSKTQQQVSSCNCNGKVQWPRARLRHHSDSDGGCSCSCLQEQRSVGSACIAVVSRSLVVPGGLWDQGLAWAVLATAAAGRGATLTSPGWAGAVQCLGGVGLAEGTYRETNPDKPKAEEEESIDILIPPENRRKKH